MTSHRLFLPILIGIFILGFLCASREIIAGMSQQDDSRKKSSHFYRLFLNSDGFVDSQGTPSLSDVWDFIQEHPEKAIHLLQNSGQRSYLTVGVGIIACHDAVIASGGKPIPVHLRKILRRWYPDDLLNSVRWISVREPIRQLLNDARIRFVDDSLAITLMNAVVFRDDELANDEALWAHELYHVQQYRTWGVFGFARKWVENPSIDGPVEAPAYARESEARRIFSH